MVPSAWIQDDRQAEMLQMGSFQQDAMGRDPWRSGSAAPPGTAVCAHIDDLESRLRVYQAECGDRAAHQCRLERDLCLLERQTQDREALQREELCAQAQAQQSLRLELEQSLQAQRWLELHAQQWSQPDCEALHRMEDLAHRSAAPRADNALAPMYQPLPPDFDVLSAASHQVAHSSGEHNLRSQSQPMPPLSAPAMLAHSPASWTYTRRTSDQEAGDQCYQN